MFFWVGEKAPQATKRTWTEPLGSSSGVSSFQKPRWGVLKPQARPPGICPELLSGARPLERGSCLRFYGCKIRPHLVSTHTKERGYRLDGLWKREQVGGEACESHTALAARRQPVSKEVVIAKMSTLLLYKQGISRNCLLPLKKLHRLANLTEKPSREAQGALVNGPRLSGNPTSSLPSPGPPGLE